MTSWLDWFSSLAYEFMLSVSAIWHSLSIYVTAFFVFFFTFLVWYRGPKALRILITNSPYRKFNSYFGTWSVKFISCYTGFDADRK